MVNVLHVIQLFKHIYQLHHLGTLFSVQLHGDRCHHGYFSICCFQTRSFERIFDGCEAFGRGDHINGVIFISHHIFSTGFPGIRRRAWTDRN